MPFYSMAEDAEGIFNDKKEITWCFCYITSTEIDCC